MAPARKTNVVAIGRKAGIGLAFNGLVVPLVPCGQIRMIPLRLVFAGRDLQSVVAAMLIDRSEHRIMHRLEGRRKDLEDG